MKKRENITADIPLDLRQWDEELKLYGRWAMDRPRQMRCGSAEGGYLPGKGEALEARREPREVLMLDQDALQCNKAIQRIPQPYRFIIQMVYIPTRLRLEVILRTHHISAREARERHLSGLRYYALTRESQTREVTYKKGLAVTA